LYKVKELEQKRATENTAAMSATQIQLEQAKHELDAATVTEQEWSARESELASPLKQARSKVAEARSRLTELEQAVDAAIQQFPKQP
jgi:chromosome segregation ATPase